MSRLIIKNLPSGMKEERFKSLFGAFGTLTDGTLKFTKNGKFRKFGFVGFKTEEEAQAAFKHFNKSYIDTSRIAVEFCKSFGDPGLPKAWSKHTQKNSTGETPKMPEEQEGQNKEKDKKKKLAIEELESLKKDSNFEEFLAVHQKRCKVPTWTNDTLSGKKEEARKVDDYLNFDSDDSEELSEEEDIKGTKGAQKKRHKNLAVKKTVSDMDYLRSKVVKTEEVNSEINEGSETDEEIKLSSEGNALLHTIDDDKEQDGKLEKLGQESKKKEALKQSNKNEATTQYTLKLRGAHFNVKETQVREFFVPLKPVAIRIVKNANGNATGYVFVDFQSEDDLEKALKRDREYMGRRYVELFRMDNAQKTKPVRTDNQKWLKREKKAGEVEEDVSESGRLFVRNLPYTCAEDDLEKVFSKYGPLSEIHFPIDNLTKTPKGFAFITFMIPEHAVRALAELDGDVFQGRMMHILPSMVKEEKDESDSNLGSSAFKRNKAAQEKARSNSSHNWNTLFVGSNAVADAIAAKYNATKSQVLDHEGKGSVAVRMALGETQIVQETRQFLVDNGVSLDSFSQAAGPRSKAVILVKNIPADTQVGELENLFKKHGDVGRVLLPPAGVSAIVEFFEPTEAKQAFTKLAYSKFQHVPLYLEWAPMDVFSTPVAEKKQSDKDDQDELATNENDSCEEEDECIPGCTLFVKNLNFSTAEETLKKAFSKCGSLKSCSISKKKSRTGSLLSMGYGFVEYTKPEYANKALKLLQHIMLDDHQLELKLSDRVTKSVHPARKLQKAKDQKASKILIRNIPFQAKVKEIRELFSTFGEIKSVRLPKKMGGTGTHRGFGFVEFLTKQEAKKAFNALCHSTHLFGRRLVLEWADSEDTLEALRRKTAEHYYDSPNKKKRAEILDEIMDDVEGED
ncbi:putative RNA-binding protein 19 isoform X2 [Rhinoraja longicauda]